MFRVRIPGDSQLVPYLLKKRHLARYKAPKGRSQKLILKKGEGHFNLEVGEKYKQFTGVLKYL